MQQALNIFRVPPHCVNCRHFKLPPNSDVVYGRCSHFATVTIHGKAEQLYAEVARAIVCTDGKYFEHKK